MIQRLLTHPLMRGRCLDDPRTTQLRKQLIQEKKFLKKIYQEWYKFIAREVVDIPGFKLELGSGAGFMQETIPGLIKSEIFHEQDIHIVLDGIRLPFSSHQFAAIVMTDVFHHISKPREFMREAVRVLQRGGKIVMIEPWVTRWSRWVYPRFHHEPLQLDVKEWDFPSSGPLSGANQALPWIIFDRDRERFEREFKDLKIKKIKNIMPFRYLLSGGVSLRALMPGFTFSFWRWLEEAFFDRSDQWGMFALIVLQVD